jgi:hypothetical protein
MRRVRSSVRLAAALLAALGVAGPRAASAQRGVADDGALFLLLPVGARSVGIGQAVTAAEPGTEGVWWNPASIARATKPVAAIHHSQSVVGTGDAITAALPSSLLGVFALSIDILNYERQDLTDAEQGINIGSLLPRSFVYAATYATTAGDHVRAGVTYKVLQFRLDCSGTCPTNLAFAATSSAFDAGLQVEPTKRLPLTIGASVRNVGPRLQVNDSPQSDPLPTRVEVGAQYRLDRVAATVPDVGLHLNATLIDRIPLRGPSARVGADAIYRERVHFRAGYVFENADAGGAAIGLGFVAGSLGIDIARQFGGLSAEIGQAPTYLSLEYSF